MSRSPCRSYFSSSSVGVPYHQHFENVRVQLNRTLDVVREHAIRVFETHVLIATQVELLALVTGNLFPVPPGLDLSNRN